MYLPVKITPWCQQFFEDLKFSEISKQLNVSEGGLKANYHHAVKKIENILLRELNLFE